MRKSLKVLHTIASSGIIGALFCYMIVLIYAPQATVSSYSDVRQTIAALCNYILLPSLGVALVTGLLAMAVHRPFQEMRWVWVKALLGLLMFESTFAIVQSKANTAAGLASKIAAGEQQQVALSTAIAAEWTTLWAILALSLANVVLGVWRPRLGRK